MEDSEKVNSNNIFTIIAITAVAWPLFAMFHEIIGHGFIAYVLGENVLGAVSTTVHIEDFYNLDNVAERIGWWGFRLVASGGTLINLFTGLVALVLLRSSVINSPQLRFFLWLFASISIFQQAFWMAVMPFAALGGDWTAFFIEIELPLFWKITITLFGILLMWIGYYYPLKFWKPDLGTNRRSSRIQVLLLTSIPFISAFVIQYLSVISSPLAGPRHTTIPAIFSFIPLVIWLVLVNVYRKPWFNPNIKRTVINLNYYWIIIGLIFGVFFIVILGSGIGVFEGHPDY